MSTLYHHTEAIHNLSAPGEIVPILIKWFNPASVLDVGCGTGTWLKVFEVHGVKDYLGVDGDHLDRTLLKIPAANFTVQDLNHPFSLSRKFDLVMSLEVAEHLEEQYADQLIDSLTAHGDTIIFSAAIPGQGGQNHFNEQWPAYWEQKFERRGFYFHDIIRPIIWNRDNIEWWYRQNLFVVRKYDGQGNRLPILATVHPVLFEKVVRDNDIYLANLNEGKQGLRVSAGIFLKSIAYKIKTFLG